MRCYWCRASLSSRWIVAWCSVWNNGAYRTLCFRCAEFMTHDYTGGTFDRYPDGRLKSEWAAAYSEIGL